MDEGFIDVQMETESKGGSDNMGLGIGSLPLKFE